ncbi:hypothetical protein PIB30_063609 [Stylosanthes scabra]|uniref:Uncharacterized protein n=1 Tax=Stylosanthes scabra TaxID=79078 RepID=A0ABU6WJS1_9FABA|nr:hypothetical protein [Stylosanthes scabra]
MPATVASSRLSLEVPASPPSRRHLSRFSLHVCPSKLHNTKPFEGCGRFNSKHVLTLITTQKKDSSSSSPSPHIRCGEEDHHRRGSLLLDEGGERWNHHSCKRKNFNVHLQVLK